MSGQRVTSEMLAAAEDIARAIDPAYRHQFLDLLRSAQKVVAGMLDRPVFHEHYAWREVVSATRVIGAGLDGARMAYIHQLCLAVVRGDHAHGEAQTARDSVRLLGIIDRAIEASDNDGGSASDAIQDVLTILSEARRS